MIGFEIHKYADISTCHLTKQDNDLLHARTDRNPMEPGPIVYEYDEGYFVYVSQDDEYTEECKRGGFSDQFCRIIKEAQAQRINFVRFDAEGAETDGLESYDWEDECSHPNAVPSDDTEPATSHCPDCGENFIEKKDELSWRSLMGRPQSTCENCGKPAEYDPVMCLCKDCIKDQPIA